MPDAVTRGLKKWRNKELIEVIRCDTNIKEVRDWIFKALEECQRHDLVDELKNTDIDNIINTLSKKVTQDRSKLYGFLGIDSDTDDRTQTLEDKTKTDLKSWLQTQCKKFWKYQHLLHAFSEQGCKLAKEKIVKKFNIKESSIKYQMTDTDNAVSINDDKIEEVLTNKRHIDISAAGIQGEPFTKKMKKERFQERKVSGATFTGPEQSSSSESMNLTDDAERQDIIYSRCEIADEANDEHADEIMAFGSDTHIVLRDYQQELAEIALKGQNTIICAGTNSGKTYVALHIIKKHLCGNPNGTIAFFARTNVLLRQQFRLACKKLPYWRSKILGLTASPGTKKAKDVESAKEHLTLIMANLDIWKLSVVQQYESSLLKKTSIPEKVQIKSTKRRNDPVQKLLKKAMDDVEDMFDSKSVTAYFSDHASETKNIFESLRNPPKDRTTVSFIQWVVETRRKVEKITKNQSTIPRLIHACLRHLEFYAECLEVNSLLDIINVRDVLYEGYKRLKEESAKAVEQKEKDLLKILEEVYSEIFELGKRIAGNPDIDELIKTLEKEYENRRDESRFLVFVKTRLTAKALAEKMPEHFNSRYLTGSQVSKEEGGLSVEEQDDIVARFRKGKHICVVATSVASEGLDIQNCTVVIKYRLITNEISSLQMRGRIRAEGGKEFMVGSQEEFEKEDINVERQFLMHEAIQLVLKEDIKIAILTKERNIFQIEEQRRRTQKINSNDENKGNFYVGCKHCPGNIEIIDGQFIRRIKSTHSIVCGKDIFSSIERRKTKSTKTYDVIKKTDKVFGLKCGHNWGSILIYQECEFVSLSQDNIQIINKDTLQSHSFKKWSEVCSEYPIDNITDEEVIKYRSQPTPSHQI